MPRLSKLRQKTSTTRPRAKTHTKTQTRKNRVKAISDAAAVAILKQSRVKKQSNAQKRK